MEKKMIAGVGGSFPQCYVEVKENQYFPPPEKQG